MFVILFIMLSHDHETFQMRPIYFWINKQLLVPVLFVQLTLSQADSLIKPALFMTLLHMLFSKARIDITCLDEIYKCARLIVNARTCACLCVHLYQQLSFYGHAFN